MIKNVFKAAALGFTTLCGIGACIDADNLTTWALVGVTYAILAVAEELNHD